MNIKDCKGCVYFHKYYGNKNKQGKRVISGYFCSAKNGKISNFPKECSFKKDSY